jgi:hypothetical protein
MLRGGFAALSGAARELLVVPDITPTHAAPKPDLGAKLNAFGAIVGAKLSGGSKDLGDKVKGGTKEVLGNLGKLPLFGRARCSLRPAEIEAQPASSENVYLRVEHEEAEHSGAPPEASGSARVMTDSDMYSAMMRSRRQAPVSGPESERPRSESKKYM